MKRRTTKRRADNIIHELSDYYKGMRKIKLYLRQSDEQIQQQKFVGYESLDSTPKSSKQTF